MAKGIYVGVGGAVRKVKNPYIGVGGVVRKVKKVFVGVGGVKLAWGGEIQKISTTLKLSSARMDLAGASVGKYALVAGGVEYYRNMDASSVVESFNEQLVKGMATALLTPSTNLEGITTPTHAVFAGGQSSTYSDKSYVRDVNMYDSSLTRITPAKLFFGRSYLGGATVGQYFLFAGGTNDDLNPTARSLIDCYDASLARTSRYLTKNASGAASVSTARYAFFENWFVDAFDSSLVKTECENIKDNTGGGYPKEGSASVGKYAVFVRNTSSYRASAYDSDTLVRTYLAPVNYLTYCKGANTKDGSNALFVGGGRTFPANRAFDIDSNLVVRELLPLDTELHNPAITGIGSYMLVCGGETNSSSSRATDAVNIYEY